MPEEKAKEKMKAKVEPKVEVKPKSEPVVTDVLEEYYFEGKVEMVRRRHMAGDVLVKEEIHSA